MPTTKAIGPSRDHNNPPEMLDLAKETTGRISQWFADNPVVSSEGEAREIKLQIDRAKLCLKDLEDDRDRRVRPLNEQVGAINAQHRAVRHPLGSLLDQMLASLDDYLKKEEERRLKAAAEARRKAREAEEKAREAERIEQERLEDLAMGEVGIDVAAVTIEADAAFEEFTKAEREAIRLEANVVPKVRGGFSRAISIREKEVLNIADPVAFMVDIVNICATEKLPPGLQAAMLTAARTIRRVYGRLPAGITVTLEREAK